MSSNNARDVLVRHAYDAFRADAAAPPPLSLRGGCDIDDYRDPQPFDSAQDESTDAYLERFAFWGLAYLDAQSWRHYLPRLIEYACDHQDDPAMVAESLVRSLRPPDRYPPRLASLTADQESMVRQFLERIARGDAPSGTRADAQQALEEWWLPNPRSRPTADEIAAARAEPVVYRDVDGPGYRLSVPVTLTGSGPREIPSESRHVATWGGYLCWDAHTVVAVNVMPLAVRSLDDSIRLFGSRFRQRPEPRDISVAFATRACRLDGLVDGNGPAEAQSFTIVFAMRADRVTMLTVRSWPRDDVRRIVERIVASFQTIP